MFASLRAFRSLTALGLAALAVSLAGGAQAQTTPKAAAATTRATTMKAATSRNATTVKTGGVATTDGGKAGKTAGWAGSTFTIPKGIDKGVFTGFRPVSAFAHAEAITPPYELQIVNIQSIQRTSGYPAATMPNPQVMAHNPWIEFDFIVAPNIDAYINPVGGLTRQYDTIGWLGDIYTEACLTVNEAKLWPGAVNLNLPADTSCQSVADVAGGAFVPRAWYQVADSKADLYVVQKHGFVNIPTKVMVNVQQTDVPLRFHLKGSQLYYTTSHTGPNNPAVCPGNVCPAMATDMRTGTFETIVLPLALIQLKALPENIVYLPPGSKSSGQLSITKTFGTTMSAGEISQIDNTTSQDDWIEHTTSTSASGGILKIISFGYNDTTDGRFDKKTSLKSSQSVERDVAVANQQAVVFTHKMQAGAGARPGATGTYQKAPFWDDLVVVMMHPQLAVWDFFGRKQVQLISALNSAGNGLDQLLAQPDDVPLSISQLDTCASGAPLHVPMPNQPDEILSQTECLALAKLDPFYGHGQSADLSSRGQLLKNSEQYGLDPQHAMGEGSITIQDTVSDTLSLTNSNTASYAATVEDILATSQSTGITLGGGSGPVVPMVDLGLSQTSTLKQGSTLDKATTMTLTYKNSTATSYRTDVSFQGVIDDATTGLPAQPEVEIWQDDAFGGLMFRDPDAPAS